MCSNFGDKEKCKWVPLNCGWTRGGRVGHGRGAMKASTMIACIALAVLALVVLFPPVDFYRPASPGIWIGDSQTPGTSEIKGDRGFTFIGEVGGPLIIRYQQWYSMMGAVAAIGVAAFAIAARGKKPDR